MSVHDTLDVFVGCVAFSELPGVFCIALWLSLEEYEFPVQGWVVLTVSPCESFHFCDTILHGLN